MTEYYDNLETRSHDERTTDLSKQLPSQIQNAKEKSEAFGKILADVHHQDIVSRNLTWDSKSMCCVYAR